MAHGRRPLLSRSLGETGLGDVAPPNPHPDDDHLPLAPGSPPGCGPLEQALAWRWGERLATIYPGGPCTGSDGACSSGLLASVEQASERERTGRGPPRHDTAWVRSRLGPGPYALPGSSLM